MLTTKSLVAWGRDAAVLRNPLAADIQHSKLNTDVHIGKKRLHRRGEKELFNVLGIFLLIAY